MHWPFPAVAIIVWALVPTSGRAQASHQDSLRAPTFKTLTPGQWVRVSSDLLGRREGRLLDHRAGDVLLSLEPTLLHIPAARIDTLWTRGSSAKSGAIVGAVLLGALGIVVAGTINQGESDYNAGEAAAFLGVAGAATGALLGGVIGSAVPKWKRRFPERRQRDNH